MSEISLLSKKLETLHVVRMGTMRYACAESALRPNWVYFDNDATKITNCLVNMDCRLSVRMAKKLTVGPELSSEAPITAFVASAKVY